MTRVIMFNNTKKWTWSNIEKKKSLSKYRNAGQDKQTLVLSQSFQEKRGLLKECPLSMILCILLAKIILKNIRQNNGIKGIVIDGKELKTSAFDDYVIVT